MPTYEYECMSCGYRYELFQSMTEEPRKRCPKCRHKVRRLVGSGAGIIFKGSGFYATDYRKPEKKAHSTIDTTSSESKVETKSDSKSDGKISTKSEKEKN
ncbi:MAG: zinc ribbon domain-containing protein [Candidatus Eisenbacteria bacterium]|uniref:Zinc ribbon domain-containing protein n=1 Tax=Eiseniibacteriota bacterium TaxID=2212470 RepID=A0A948RXU7_UNCEI|nr:zinc ribbon domain-containing protein [Candidatus Eisenbacteria bacterium]MBU1947353.1 zinc ribbon domain-containing protein [Candidatus Eisenbacteria bacterium]MBU2692466.1 zinc ribbon domain-containing protein [Candidatus Eisenbacteria bacterium]